MSASDTEIALAEVVVVLVVIAKEYLAVPIKLNLPAIYSDWIVKSVNVSR